MNSCQCEGIEREFNREGVAKELNGYRRKGLGSLDKTTRMLIDAVKAQGVAGMTLLDVGGGIGAIQHELLKAGASSAVQVDASQAYIQAAKEEAERMGVSDRIKHYHGNFVELAHDIEPADIVTLDKVICCFDDMEALVGRSSEKVRRLYGLVYPRDTWWIKLVLPFANSAAWLKRSPFRSFVHSTEAVDAIAHENGLEEIYHHRTFVWQVLLYSRQSGLPKAPA